MTHLKEKTSLWNDLTDEQSEKLVGGVGSGDVPGAGIAGWNGDGTHGLAGAGFAPPGVQMTVGANDLTVTTPGPKG